jgi:hypothetical protein
MTDVEDINQRIYDLTMQLCLLKTRYRVSEQYNKDLRYKDRCRAIESKIDRLEAELEGVND